MSMDKITQSTAPRGYPQNTAANVVAEAYLSNPNTARIAQPLERIEASLDNATNRIHNVTIQLELQLDRMLGSQQREDFADLVPDPYTTFMKLDALLQSITQLEAQISRLNP